VVVEGSPAYIYSTSIQYYNIDTITCRSALAADTRDKDTRQYQSLEDPIFKGFDGSILDLNFLQFTRS
jgi:hypothetical protein